MNVECVFCKIVNRSIPATVIAENDDVLVIQDRSPKAPVHYLIITKHHASGIVSLKPNELSLGQALFAMAQQLSRTLPGSGDFRLIINNGTDAGQSVFHLHAHFLASKKMTDF
jgi:histidine triad (HIT) family protein